MKSTRAETGVDNQRPPSPSVFNAVKPSRAIAVDVTAVGADQEKTYQKHVLHEAARPVPLKLELIQAKNLVKGTLSSRLNGESTTHEQLVTAE